jgi:phospholipid/cholesterol/gamma-HCH transport system ATP-binding protein
MSAEPLANGQAGGQAASRTVGRRDEPAGDEPALLELREARLGGEKNPIVGPLSLRFEAGRCALVAGGSGSGKSTLLKLAAGILPPDGGEAYFKGRPLLSLSRRELLDFHRRCGFAFQDAALWSNQSLYDNVAFPLRFHRPGIGAREVEAEVKRVVGLVGYGRALKARPADLSGGERQLVGLARALILDPEIVFLDEPTASLDEEETARVIDLVAGLRARGRTVVIAGSGTELAYRIADDIDVMIGGKVAASGSYDEALAWSDPQFQSSLGRLKQRRTADSLLGAWETALSDGPSVEGE